MLVERTKSRYWFQEGVVGRRHAGAARPDDELVGEPERRRWQVRRRSSRYWEIGRFQKMVMLGSFQMSHWTVSPAAPDVADEPGEEVVVVGPVAVVAGEAGDARAVGAPQVVRQDDELAAEGGGAAGLGEGGVPAAVVVAADPAAAGQLRAAGRACTGT